MEKKNGNEYCYQLWGHDTFSDETYLCGVYRHYSSAHRAKGRHTENSCFAQDEGLRDAYWITKTTREEYDAMNDTRMALVKSVLEHIENDVEQVESILPDVDSFIKECTSSPGIYEFILPDVFEETCVRGLGVFFHKAPRCRVRYCFDFYVDIECETIVSRTTVTNACGCVDEVVRKIGNADLIDDLRELLTSRIQRVYQKKL